MFRRRLQQQTYFCFHERERNFQHGSDLDNNAADSHLQYLHNLRISAPAFFNI